MGLHLCTKRSLDSRESSWTPWESPQMLWSSQASGGLINWAQRQFFRASKWWDEHSSWRKQTFFSRFTAGALAGVDPLGACISMGDTRSGEFLKIWIYHDIWSMHLTFPGEVWSPFCHKSYFVAATSRGLWLVAVGCPWLVALGKVNIPGICWG